MDTKTTSKLSTLIAGAIGGAVVAVAGAVLILTGAIDTKETKTVKPSAQAPLTRPAANTKAGLTVGNIYDRDKNGVVFIQARMRQSAKTSPFGGPQDQQGAATGSGFIIDNDGMILTNAHVVEGAGDGDVQVKLGDNDPVPAKVVGSDLSSDLAVLKADPAKLKGKPLELGTSKDVKVGDPVVAIGNPFGFDNTVTSGIVSALQRKIDAPNGFQISDVLQTDAAINPGNSGGPLLDADGKVIGINSQIATGGGSGGSVGIAFSIPIDQAKKIEPQLEKGGKVERPYIGVTTAPIDKQTADQLNLPSDKGALVQNVQGGSPAAKAGLKAGKLQTDQGLVAGGDLIVKVNGKDISKPDDVAASIADKKPGDEVEIEYFRGDKKKTAKLKLAKRPSNAASGQQRPQSPGGPLPLP